MEYKDIKSLSKQELLKKKKETTEGLFNAKMKNSLGQLGSPIEIRKMRKNVARIETALRSVK